MTALAFALAGCETDTVFVPVDPGTGAPDAPVAVDARYYAGAVTVSWEFGQFWNGEAFRVYSKRVADPDWFLIAEVSSCVDAFCEYRDINLSEEVEYEYYVAAVDDFGVETGSRATVRVFVPRFTPPPVPGDVEVVALDGSLYLRWDARAREVLDFSHYRVWVEIDGVGFLLGETDSEGFLDELAENGVTYGYYVSSVDLDGHESAGSATATGTPRPDFHGEVLFDWFSDPIASGFVFQSDEGSNPIVAGSDPLRHFRLEVDSEGWWLVPGPGTTVHPTAWATTALRCGPGADATCTDLRFAPQTGYVAQDLFLESQTSYVLRVPGADNQPRYATIRVVTLGFDQDDVPLVIFDWAWQLQPGNPALLRMDGTSARLRGGG